MLEEFEHDLDEVVLIPSRGGVFEVYLDGHRLFSKKRAKRHAEYDEVLKAAREIIRG